MRVELITLDKDLERIFKMHGWEIVKIKTSRKNGMDCWEICAKFKGWENKK